MATFVVCQFQLNPYPMMTIPHRSIRFLLCSASLLGLLLAPIASNANADSQASPVTLALDDVVNLVVKHNPNLKVAQSSIEQATAAIKTAGALPNPRLESTMGNNRAAIPTAIGGQVTGFAFSQLFENPNLRKARINAADFGRDASVHSLAATTNELAAQVRTKAYEHLLRKDESRATLDALNLLEQIRQKVKVRVESGEAARYEIIKADAEVISARQKYQTAVLQAEQSLLALNRLAGGQLPQKWQLRESLSDPIDTPSLAETLAEANQNNPELKVLQAEVSKRQAKLAESRSSRWPGIELRYGQQREPEIRQNMLSASIQVPIFDQRVGPVREAEADLKRLSLQLDGRRIDLAQQINLAWKSIEIARIRVNALSTGSVREAQSALRVAEAAYRFGERGILDVLDAQRVLRTVSADLLDAKYQYQIAKIELNFLAGSDAKRTLTSQ
jgi:outer membrane protein, heavy metal efflux system